LILRIPNIYFQPFFFPVRNNKKALNLAEVS